MSLGIRKRTRETWRRAAERIGEEYGLESEVVAEYDACIRQGHEPSRAAWMACYEWDVCERADNWISSGFDAPDK